MNHSTFSELKRVEATNKSNMNVLISGTSGNFVHSLLDDFCSETLPASDQDVDDRSEKLAALRSKNQPQWYKSSDKVSIVDGTDLSTGWIQNSLRHGALKNASSVCFNGKPALPSSPEDTFCDWRTPDSLRDPKSNSLDIEIRSTASLPIQPYRPVDRENLFLRPFHVRADRSVRLPFFRALYPNIPFARDEKEQYTLAVLPTSSESIVVVFIVPDEKRELRRLVKSLSWSGVARKIQELDKLDFLTFYIPRVEAKSGGLQTLAELTRYPKTGAFLGKSSCLLGDHSTPLRLRVTQEFSMSLAESEVQERIDPRTTSSALTRVRTFNSRTAPRHNLFLARPFIALVLDTSTGALLSAASIHDPSNSVAISAPLR